MLRFITLCLCAAFCLAQSPAAKPPADVDEALRMRANQFFQLLIENKYRQAEAFVAEESKDAYYNGQKPKYLNYELKGIEYSDGFTRAKVSALCETVMVMGALGSAPIKVTIGSNWKLINGEWFWFVDPDAARRTPFGPMMPSSGPRTAALPSTIPADPGFAMGKVKADKTALDLKPGATGEVTFTNGAPGPMSISLQGRIPGVDVKLDRVNLTSGEKAILTVLAHAGAQSGTLSVQVDQTNEVIPIRVNVQ